MPQNRDSSLLNPTRPSSDRGESGDPRNLPDFNPAHFPLCDGLAAPPPDTTDPVARRQLEFLAVYYRLNQLYARLQTVRDSAGPAEAARVLRQIQQAVHDRDALEDRYEPQGFIGEPEMEGVFYRNLEFTHALKRHHYRPLSSSSFRFSIPMPPAGVTPATWVREHLATAAAMPD